MAAPDPKDILGRGLRWPLAVTPTGDLALTDDEESLWQSIELLLGTMEPPPLDPDFHLDVGVYDPLRDAGALGHAIGRALQRNEPRIARARVELLRYDVEEGRVVLRLEITPIQSLTQYTRTFPWYIGSPS